MDDRIRLSYQAVLDQELGGIVAFHRCLVLRPLLGTLFECRRSFDMTIYSTSRGLKAGESVALAVVRNCRNEFDAFFLSNLHSLPTQ